MDTGKDKISGDILIVEDIIESLKYIYEILNTAGYTVRPASDGNLALRSIDFKIPDLILMDITLPDINGIEICRRLKTDPKTKDIPVIFISASNEIDLKIEALNEGGVDYVTKPFNPTEVLTRIRIHLQMAKIQKVLIAQKRQLEKEILERKKIEIKLQQSEALLNASQHLAKVGGWWWNVASQTMFWTDETYHIHEMNPADFEPGTIEHIVRSEHCYEKKDRAIILNAFHICAEKGISFDMKFPFTTVKGNKIWIRTTAKAEIINDRIIGVIGTIMDITEQNKIETEIKKYREHLEELVSERTRQLENKNKELEHFNDLFVNREFRIKELKDRVKELERGSS